MHRYCLILAAIFLFAVGSARGAELVMVEEQGCLWCAAWNRTIAPIYPKTAEGKFAPLRRIDILEPVPADLTLSSRPFFTPTFILVENGRELGRIEGYPGEDFFWGLLARMLQENTSYKEPNS